MVVTVKQISELARVSRGTVDRVLNNRGKVRPEIAQRVLKIADELGYRPNKIGKALASYRTPFRIGVVVMSIGNDFFNDVLEGINDAGEEFADFGVQVVVKTMKGFDVSVQIALIDELVKERISALAIVPINDAAIVSKLNELHGQGIVTVMINSDIEGATRLAYVGSNYIKGGETACGLMALITKGSANIGVVTGSTKMLGHNQRIDGFREIAKTRFPDMKIVDVVQNNDDEFESYDVVKTLLQTHPEIDALYLAAAGVYGACRAVKSLHLDHKLTIICFDDVEHTRQLVYDGTIAATICQQPRTQGYLSIKILCDYYMENIKPKDEFNYTQAEIKIRENL